MNTLITGLAVVGAGVIVVFLTLLLRYGRSALVDLYNVMRDVLTEQHIILQDHYLAFDTEMARQEAVQGLVAIQHATGKPAEVPFEASAEELLVLQHQLIREFARHHQWAEWVQKHELKDV